MAETIKGGAYQNPDGSWVDANGKPLSSKQVQEFEAVQSEKPPHADPIPLAAAPVSPPVTAVTDVPPAAAPTTSKRGRSKGGA
jgi:hypothetical protein